MASEYSYTVSRNFFTYLLNIKCNKDFFNENYIDLVERIVRYSTWKIVVVKRSTNIKS